MSKIRPHLLVPVLLFSVLSAMVLMRLHEQPMQPYGTDAAHYIEHTARLDLVKTIRDVDFGAHSSDSIGSFVEDLDGSFPPLLHLVTAAIGGAHSHSVDGILWTGLLWLGLLAAGVAGITRLLSGSASTAAAAFCATALLPAAHASATRYYYDLPMTTILWLMVFSLLALRRHPLIAATLTGSLLFAACITKWTALPFGLLMLMGAALCTIETRTSSPGAGRWARILAPIGAPAHARVPTLIFLHLAGNHDSFTAMLGDIGERGEIWGPQGVDTGRFAAASDHIFRDLQPLSVQRLRFYAVRIVTSVFSPGLLLLLLSMSALWMLRSRRGWPLIAVTILGQGAFLLLRIPPTDERFVLTMAPALTMAAALGWGELPTRARGPIAAVFIVLSLAVAADFHLSPRDSASGPTRALGEEGLSDLMLWGLNDSSDQRGWARHDQQRDNRDQAREQLWTELALCETDVFKIAAERSLVSSRGARGDLYWLRYRSRLSELEESGRARRVLLSCDEANADERELALSAVRPSAKPRRPRCISAATWQLEGLVPVGDSGQKVAIWSPHGNKQCPGLK